jgi:hypothetical protein
VVCQQHKPLHRKTISNEKSSTKDEGCIVLCGRSDLLLFYVVWGFTRCCFVYFRVVTVCLFWLSTLSWIKQEQLMQVLCFVYKYCKHVSIAIEDFSENNLIKVYLCVRGIYFASFYEFDIWVWNSDSVGCVFFILLIYWTKRFRLLLFICKVFSLL